MCGCVDRDAVARLTMFLSFRRDLTVEINVANWKATRAIRVIKTSGCDDDDDDDDDDYDGYHDDDDDDDDDYDCYLGMPPSTRTPSI